MHCVRHSQRGGSPERSPSDKLGPYGLAVFGNRYAIIAVDLYYTWAEMVAVPAVTTKKVLAFAEREIFARWGVPEVIISDNVMLLLGQTYDRVLELNHVVSY